MAAVLTWIEAGGLPIKNAAPEGAAFGDESKERRSVSATSRQPAVYGACDRSCSRAERGRVEHLRRVVGIHETETVCRVFAGIAEVLGGLLERRGDVGRSGVRRGS